MHGRDILAKFVEHFFPFFDPYVGRERLRFHFAVHKLGNRAPLLSVARFVLRDKQQNFNAVGNIVLRHFS